MNASKEARRLLIEALRELVAAEREAQRALQPISDLLGGSCVDLDTGFPALMRCEVQPHRVLGHRNRCMSDVIKDLEVEEERVRLPPPRHLIHAPRVPLHLGLHSPQGIDRPLKLVVDVGSGLPGGAVESEQQLRELPPPPHNLSQRFHLALWPFLERLDDCALVREQGQPPLHLMHKLQHLGEGRGLEGGDLASEQLQHLSVLVSVSSHLAHVGAAAFELQPHCRRAAGSRWARSLRRAVLCRCGSSLALAARPPAARPRFCCLPVEVLEGADHVP
mmetsp:Transcript_16325/g.38887  ORF Transcript_16325/g.38887 Transcript_16325/m.38887 type:complete len:277 (+) Transcript_16325:402-1232(+)